MCLMILVKQLCFIPYVRAIFYFLKMENFCPEDYNLLVKKIEQMTENDLDKRRLFEKQFGYEIRQKSRTFLSH